MNPILVEPEIKYVLNHHLTTLKQINETKKNNIIQCIIIFSIINHNRYYFKTEIQR